MIVPAAAAPVKTKGRDEEEKGAKGAGELKAGRWKSV
ncbi:predicted protein [Sclerotinia sclerotiorum 1980 UF-70]|uniref:Uncharacterized protein n=1 Tax=Sclerotinia sclerotiorum (strain ATCC 18683 / 1980 / Ss-1) TaxID=665079 RepID=A7EA44_SCLS1|nr:predicted protein [Sclerotinia sclerotiorum 1980 UF-70]EDN99322.1 predicted protein [Sclerotinia sclerotiorum 1980 UF-70]